MRTRYARSLRAAPPTLNRGSVLYLPGDFRQIMTIPIPIFYGYLEKVCTVLPDDQSQLVRGGC